MIVLLLLLPLFQAAPKPHRKLTQTNLVGGDDFSDQESHGLTHPSLVGTENHLNRQVKSNLFPFKNIDTKSFSCQIPRSESTTQHQILVKEKHKGMTTEPIQRWVCNLTSDEIFSNFR